MRGRRVTLAAGRRAAWAAFALALALAHPGRAGEPGAGRGAPLAPPPPASVVVRAIAPSGALGETERDPFAPAPLIVLFRGSPAPLTGNGSRASPRAVSAALDAMDGERGSFFARLRSAGLAPSDRPFRRDFRRALDGVAIDAPPVRWAEIASFPEVASVHADAAVEASLEASVPLVGAASVARDLGATGAGTTVAILDTGVDYRHPDLGAGFGPGHKVAGGYDLVNDDPDPADDNGHGTLVAGILAASGSARGVAPGATILAYKVLDSRGRGLASDVIAGIERALDPDGDPTTDDAADVANLSFGGSGTPDDPMSLAVDAAARAGLLCVVAAGNGGPDPYGVSSPGVARGALTVGATDKLDRLASFSGRGPVPGTYEPKPDLVAPGVDISSLGRGSGRRTSSGTSMATPHVAGAAALLLSLFPELGAKDIAALLVESARPIGEGPVRAGAGRLDVAAAAVQRIVVHPRTFSLGHDEGSPAAGERVRKLRVKNRSNRLRSFSARLKGEPPLGVAAIVEPETFVLGPGESGSISVRVRSDEGPFPGPAGSPYAFEGAVEVRSDDGDRARVPWIYTRVPTLVVECEPPPWTLLVHDRTATVEFLVEPGPRVVLPLPAGEYDIVALFRDAATMVVSEGVRLPRAERLSLRSADAVHVLSFSPRGASGEAFVPEYGASALVHGSSGVAQIVLGAVPRVRRLSDIGEAYDYESSYLDLGPEGSVTLTSDGRRGVFESATVENDPARFAEWPLAFDSLDPSTADPTALVWMAFVSRGSVFQGTSSGNTLPLGSPPRGVLRLEPAPYAGFRLHAGAWLASGDPLGPGSRLLRFFPYFQAAPDPRAGRLEARLWGRSERLYSLAMDAFDPDAAPLRFSARATIEDDRVRLAGVSGRANYFFLSATGAFTVDSGLAWRLERDRALVSSGRFASAGNLGHGVDREVVPLPGPGAYELEVTLPSHRVEGVAGSASARLSFDTRRADRDPPAVRALAFIENGRATSRPSAGGGAAVHLEVEDASPDVDVRLRLYVDGDGRREIAVPLDRSGRRFRGTMPSLPAGAAIALRLEIADPAGNTLECRLKPGFRADGSSGR